jgi:mannosyltransferase
MTKLEKISLYTIIAIAFILRFYHLSFQSLWLDELHTMIEADPKRSLSELFNYLKCCDQHPPLFFLIEKFAFTIFGHTEFVARLLPALAGTASVWVLYLLGKETANRQVGLTAALLITFNFYNIQYSQEARGYIFAFLFTSLSFLHLIKFFKQQTIKSVVLYALFTLMMLYTHYFGLFVFISQCVIGLIYWLAISKEKTAFFKRCLLALVVIVICFAPWIPFILEMSNIKSFWIAGISPDFAMDHFKEYFGNNSLLYPLLTFFTLLYLYKAAKEKEENTEPNPTFLFIVLSIWISLTLLIPYIRSLLTIPMLVPRYTIVVLPAFILMISLGIESIKNKMVRYILLAIFITISTIDLLAVKKYYSKVNKTQFREITNYIANYKIKNIPIVNIKTAWQFQYYASVSNISNLLLGENTDAILDSLNNLTNPYGFWLVGTHNSPKLSDEKIKSLENNFAIIEDSNFFDGWTQLYLPYTSLHGTKQLTFHSSLYFDIEKEKIVPLWGKSFNANTIPLEKGKYTFKITSRGTQAENTFPEIIILANNKKIGSYVASEQKSQYVFDFEASGEPITFTFEMTNDLTKTSTNEDRNLFIYKAFVTKIN